MKTLLRIGAQLSLRRAYPPRSHDKLSLHPFKQHPRPGWPGRYLLNLLQTPDGGGERIRTDDLLLAKQALSQLSYTPVPGIRRQESGIRNSDY